MENVQEKKKTNKGLIKLLIIVAIIGVVSMALASFGKQGSAGISTTPCLQRFSISELNKIALNKGAVTCPIIETSGQIVKKISENYSPSVAGGNSYLFVLEDSGSKSIVALTSSNSGEGDSSSYSQFSTGDRISVIGAFEGATLAGFCKTGELGATSTARAASEAAWCNSVGEEYANIPFFLSAHSLALYFGRPAIQLMASTQTAAQESPTPQPTQPVTSSAVSISTAIKEYSDALAANVDVVGIVTSMQPARADSVTASWGNTIIISDGLYSAAVHNVSTTDFNNISGGDTVEVRGGYMQNPEQSASGGLVVQIFNVKSVSMTTSFY